MLDAYATEEHWRHDLIVEHIVRNVSPFIWCTQEQLAAEATYFGARFGEFVRDSGEKSIVAIPMTRGKDGDVRCVTYCSRLPEREVLNTSNLARIEMVAQLMLPWLDWPDDQRGKDFVALPSLELSPREKEALRLLAGGLQTARIAEAMGIAEGTVSLHLRSARSKLNARTREEALAKAIRARQL